MCLRTLRSYGRRFMNGMFSIHQLEEIETGTRVYLYFGAIPRSMLGSAALRLGFPSIEKAYRRVLPALAQQLDRLRPDVLQFAAPPLGEVAEQRMRSAKQSLVECGLSRTAVDTLIEYIRTADNTDLHRIQIRERARVWKLPEQDLLRVALHATRQGLLALSWDTICPHCRGVRDENPSLAALKAGSHCDACNVDFTTDTQESVEVTFRVHPSIRDVPDQVYCSAEPAKKDHIRVQWTLPPGGKVSLTPNLKPGRYTVWRDHDGGWYLDVDDAGEQTVSWAAHPEGTVVRAKPEASVSFVNDDGEEHLFTIEEAKWSDHALRASH